MKRTKIKKLSPRANKLLLAIVLAILNVDLKEYTPAAAMLIVMFISGVNIYGCWKRLKGEL